MWNLLLWLYQANAVLLINREIDSPISLGILVATLLVSLVQAAVTVHLTLGSSLLFAVP